MTNELLECVLSSVSFFLVSHVSRDAVASYSWNEKIMEEIKRDDSCNNIFSADSIELSPNPKNLQPALFSAHIQYVWRVEQQPAGSNRDKRSKVLSADSACQVMFPVNGK